MPRICVFCGSKVGLSPLYASATAEVGRLLVHNGHDLVYGGGSIGLMGVLANAVLAAGGHMIGVIPTCLAQQEVMHPRVQDMRVVADMHIRKAMMATEADAFLTLPGGYGTLEEMFEVITWAQLGIHNKPIGILNIGGYFDPLVAWLDLAIRERFISQRNRGLVHIDTDPERLVAKLCILGAATKANA